MKSRLMVQAYLVLTTTNSGAFYSGTTSLTLIFLHVVSSLLILASSFLTLLAAITLLFSF